MSLLDRFKKSRTRAHDARAVDDAVVAHLKGFVQGRRGVEGWLEAPTSFNEPSLLLVAHDGEWTRRRVPSLDWAEQFCDRAQIPAHQAGVVPYPQRMRDYNARKKLRPEG